MSIGRRDFLKITAAAGVASAVRCTQPSFKLKDPTQKAVLKLSCQEGRAPGESLAEKLDFLEAHGYVGLEVGGRNLPDRVEAFRKALQNRKIRISAICAGFDGVIISDEAETRQLAMKSMKEILTAAGALNSTGLIIVPAFNRQASLPHKEARETLLRLLSELGDHAQSVGTRILLEPLNRREAYFLRLVADAAAICRDVDNPGIACMGDFWHMTWEETSDMGALISAGPYLHHMHIASRKNRKMPGEDEGDNYVDGFRGLKIIGFQDYVSLECGSVGDSKETIPAAARLMREQWEMA